MAIRFRTKTPPPTTPRDLELHADGSLGGWGWSLSSPAAGGPAAPLEGRSGRAGTLPTTSNRNELEAILRGLGAVLSDYPQCATLTVWSDSQYALGVISGRTKAHTNLDLVAKCRATAFEVGARGIRLDFRWVKGHDGDPGNHIADRLAALWRN